MRPEVLGGVLLHFLISTAVFTPGFVFFLDISWYTASMLAIALSFSSTVLAAKVLEGKLAEQVLKRAQQQDAP